MLDVGAMLPVLALLNLVCAWQVSRLAPAPTSQPHSNEFSRRADARAGMVGRARACRNAVPAPSRPARSARHDERGADRLRVQGAGGRGTWNRGKPAEILWRLLRESSLVTFAVQTSLSRFALEKMGLAFTTRHAVARAVRRQSRRAGRRRDSQSAIVARGAESVFRSSLFRSGYEVFYTPIPTAEKRAAKSIIDVGFDRIGDAVGGGAIRFILLLAPPVQYSAIMFSTLALLGGAARCRQPAEPRLHPDARAEPARPRRRTGSLRRPRSDHADDDAQHDVGGARSESGSSRLNRRSRLRQSSNPNHGERSRSRDSGHHVGCDRATAIASSRFFAATTS